jgi:hypothetical protein
MVPALMRLRRGRPPRWSITADIPQRSSLRRSRRICRTLMPRISLACTQLSCLPIALVITSRRVIARASRPTRHSMPSIERLYRTRRTSLNVYAPDISIVYDSIYSATREDTHIMLIPLPVRQIDLGSWRDRVSFSADCSDACHWSEQ